MSADPDSVRWLDARTSAYQASDEAVAWLDAPKPPPDAVNEYALCFHAHWLRILLLDLALFPGVVMTHEGVADVLCCPVEIVPELLARLRRDDEEVPALTARDFARVAQSN